MASPEFRRWEESVDVLGRRFVLVLEGPVAGDRYEIRVWEGAARGGRSGQYLRAPIRGRDPDEARERALEVLHNYVGVDQLRLMVEDVTAGEAPGATVRITETAREISVTLGGRYTLQVPFVMRRDDVLRPGAAPSDLAGAIREHLRAHARRR